MLINESTLKFLISKLFSYNNFFLLGTLLFILLLLINLLSVPYMNTNFIYTISYIIIIFFLVILIVFFLIRENQKYLNERFFAVILSILLISGFILRFFDLTNGGLHMDELWRLDRGRQVLLFHDWSYQLDAPPLTRIFVGLFSLLGGNNPVLIDFYTRFFLGTLLSTFTILIVYFIGSRIANKYVGLLSAFFLTFSFTHLQLSRTFMSEPYLTLFICLTLLSFFVSLEKPHFIYITMVSLLLTCLIKQTGYVLIPLIFLFYLYYTYNRKFSWGQFIGSITLFSTLFFLLTPYLVSTGNFIYLFFGPLGSPIAQVHSSQSIPWLYHYIFLYNLDTVLFFGGFFALIIACYRRDFYLLLIFIAANSMLLLITFMTFKGNEVFHRHLVTVIPLFALMTGYLFYNFYLTVKKFQKQIAILFLIFLFLLPPINLYLHDETRPGDDKWIHYNTNFKISDLKQIAFDLNNTSDNRSKIAVYFFSDFDTTVYGSMINYYYANNFYTLDNFSPKLIFLPRDMLSNPANYAKLYGIKYFVYNGEDYENFNPDNFSIIKKYPDNTRIFQYIGPEIFLGSLSDSSIDNPFTIINYSYYTQNVYYWIEAEDANISSGTGYRPFGNEGSSGIYGVASEGGFHFIKNNGSSSSYFIDFEKEAYYNVWIRMGAYTQLNVVINKSIYKISPKSPQFEWYLIGPIYLNSSKNEIKIISINDKYSIYDALLVTNDLNYHPIGVSKPRSIWGIPNLTSLNGYTLWQNESYWTLIWQSQNNQQFRVKINASSDIESIISNNISISKKFSNSSYSFNNSDNLSRRIEIQFSTKSNYLTVDLQ